MRDSLRVAALAAVTIGSTAALALAGKPQTQVVSIYAPRGVTNNCARVFSLKRAVATPTLLRGAIRALLAGPTRTERARGYGGWFSASTAGYLRGARISNGVAYIDFRNFSQRIPNASTSCGSALLLAQLDRTATQFPTVSRAIYSFNGSRNAFYNWLQLAAPAG
jgi:hypothetical protein